MANYQVTISDAQLHELLKNERALPALIQDVLNQVLKAQATEYVGAEPYERTDGRRGYRNGYRERRLVTRVGSITLEVPQFRKGQLPTELFERYQRSEVALLSTLVEMVVCGVSTRKVTNITRELCGTEISKSTVSELTKNLCPLVRTWNERSLSGMQYPFLIIDAMCIKVRKDGRVRSQSVFVGTGVNEQGYREVLGLRIGDSESEASWGEFFSWLRKRGLSGVDLVVSDDHKGLVKAAQVHFQGASWQRCQTHFTRNILDVYPKPKFQSPVMAKRGLAGAETVGAFICRQLLVDIGLRVWLDRGSM